MPSIAPNVDALMALQPVSVRPDETIRSALSLLERYPFRHLPVERENRLVGIVSDRDLALAGALSRGSGRLVQDIMHREVRTVGPDTPAVGAVEILLAYRIGALPVVVSEDRLVGIVTESDFLRRYVLSQHWPVGHAPGDPPVSALMSRPVLTTDPSEDLLEVAGRLLASNIRHLPVVVDGSIVGMLSDRDVRRALARLAREDHCIESRGERRVVSLRVEEVHSRPCMTIQPHSPLYAAAHAMLECRISALPVVEKEQLVGIVTQTDLLRHYRDWKPHSAGEQAPSPASGVA